MRFSWFWYQVAKLVPDGAKGYLIVIVGVIGAVCYLGAFMKDRKVSSLAYTLVFMLFVAVGAPMACDRNRDSPNSSAEPGASPPAPAPASAERDQRPAVDEAAIQQDLEKRARSAASFLMAQMAKANDFRQTACVVQSAEVIRQPNNLTTPYIGRVVLRVSDSRLDYTGQQHLTFQLQKHGWYLADVQASDYRTGSSGDLASPGMMSTRDSLPSLEQAQTQWLKLWKVAYAKETAGETAPTSPAK